MTQSGQNPDLLLQYQDEDPSDKFMRKAKDAPLMIGGLIGLVGAVGYGGYAYKHRGKMTTSMYLMRLRVIAQSTVIGALTLGIIASIAKKIIYPEKKEH